MCCERGKTKCSCYATYVNVCRVVETETEVIFVTDETVFENYEKICLHISKCIPKTLTNKIVSIQTGLADGSPKFPIKTIAGGDTFSYQYISKRKYPITVSVDATSFVIHPRSLCNTEEILATPTPAPATANVPTFTPGAFDRKASAAE